MDGKGAWRDNRMIERLWTSLKYEYVYLNAFETGSKMRAGISKWLAYYNSQRPHSTHGILTPDEVYRNKIEPMKFAAKTHPWSILKLLQTGLKSRTTSQIELDQADLNLKASPCFWSKLLASQGISKCQY